jgi:hypothetical protein
VKLIKRPFKEAEYETIKENNHLECAFVLTNPIKPQKPTEPEAAAPKISKYNLPKIESTEFPPVGVH